MEEPPMIRPRTLIAALAAVAGLTLLPTTTAAAHHPADRTTATTQRVTCTANDFTTGACLHGAAPSGQSMLEAAVSQAIADGHRVQAQHFVSERGRSHHDAEQQVLERLIIGQEPQQEAITSAGSGTVSGGVHTLDTTISYYDCSIAGCVVRGRVRVRISMSITMWPETYLWGELSVVSGDAVDFVQMDCVSRLDENNLPDVTVKTWSHCPDAHLRGTYTYSAPIETENWDQVGTRGAKYFNRYRFKFMTSDGWTSQMFEWETKRWQIWTAASGASWIV
jgi:hypothetical protein